jgi:hypothetical protein
MPLEWRDQSEIDSIQEQREEVARMTSMGHHGAAADEQAYLDRLLWQQKHPFIFAGEVSGVVGKGIEYYEEALKKDIKYGFDLKQPQRSFLDAHNLKQRDIKGLRVMVYPSDKKFRKEGGARDTTLGYYRIVESAMHLPPVPSPRNYAKSRRQQTVIHEIGHHIYHQSRDFKIKWWTDDIKMQRLSTRRSHTRPARVATPHGSPAMITATEESPWRIVADADFYFGSAHKFDLTPWMRTHLREGGTKRSWKNSETRYSEAWAEAFHSYRSGDLKRSLKMDKSFLDDAQGELEHAQKLKRNYKGKKNTMEWRDIKRHEKDMQAHVDYYGAIWENKKTLLNWIEKYDKKGWLLPDPKVRPKPRRKKRK